MTTPELIFASFPINRYIWDEQGELLLVDALKALAERKNLVAHFSYPPKDEKEMKGLGKGSTLDLTNEGNHVLLVIASPNGVRTEEILIDLRHLTLGEDSNNSFLWVTPSNVQLPAIQTESKTAARSNINQILAQVESGATLSADYLLLIFSASCIAALGLLTDDFISTVASMLISPLMGPILAFTFGWRLRRNQLMIQSMITGLIGMAMCILVGFLIGFVTGWKAVDWGWPSDFMTVRGTYNALITGLLVAIPSGIGVSVSILGNIVGSLVGVAISAALLPPTVNCGLFWGIAAINAAIDEETIDTKELAIMGLYSVGITVVNITIIVLIAQVFFFVRSISISRLDPFYKGIKDYSTSQKSLTHLHKRVLEAKKENETLRDAYYRVVDPKQLEEVFEETKRSHMVWRMDKRRVSTQPENLPIASIIFNILSEDQSAYKTRDRRFQRINPSSTTTSTTQKPLSTTTALEARVSPEPANGTQTTTVSKEARNGAMDELGSTSLSPSNSVSVVSMQSANVEALEPSSVQETLLGVPTTADDTATGSKVVAGDGDDAAHPESPVDESRVAGLLSLFNPPTEEEKAQAQQGDLKLEVVPVVMDEATASSMAQKLQGKGRSVRFDSDSNVIIRVEAHEQSGRNNNTNDDDNGDDDGDDGDDGGDGDGSHPQGDSGHGDFTVV